MEDTTLLENAINNNQQVQSNINQANTNQTNAVQPITIPVQIQPVIQQQAEATPSSTLSNVPNVQTNVSQVENNQNVPKPVQYQQPVQQQTQINQTSTNYQPFNIKKIDTSQYNPSTIEGQYKSAYADTINQLLNEMISIAIKDYKNKAKKVKSFNTNILEGFNGSKGSKGIKN